MRRSFIDRHDYSGVLERATQEKGGDFKRLEERKTGENFGGVLECS